MADLKGLTVRALRELARTHIGRGFSRLKTKAQLIAALEAVLPKQITQTIATRIGSRKRGASAPSRPSPEPPSPPAPAPEGGTETSEPDPEGHLVARLAGEEAARGAQIPLVEEKVHPHVTPAPGAAGEEELGELPESYGEDSLALLPKDPHSLYLLWDLSPQTVRLAFEGLPGARARMRVWREGQVAREVDFALDSRSWYLHGLDPGRTYRVELIAVAADGQTRRIGPLSNSLTLPPDGPSPVVEDRFARIPFDLPAAQIAEALRQGRESAAAPPLSDASRTRLQALSRGLPLGSSELSGLDAPGPEEGGPSPERGPGAAERLRDRPSSEVRAFSPGYRRT